MTIPLNARQSRALQLFETIVDEFEDVFGSDDDRTVDLLELRADWSNTERPARAYRELGPREFRLRVAGDAVVPSGARTECYNFAPVRFRPERLIVGPRSVGDIIVIRDVVVDDIRVVDGADGGISAAHFSTRRRELGRITAPWCAPSRGMRIVIENVSVAAMRVWYAFDGIGLREY